MVNRSKLAAAVAEARRFIERAEALPTPTTTTYNDREYTIDNFPREQGAIRRASMDLTRALADLRRRETDDVAAIKLGMSKTYGESRYITVNGKLTNIERGSMGHAEIDATHRMREDGSYFK